MPEEDTSLLAKMQQRHARGEISEEDYALFKREWEAQAQLRKRVQLIEEVARESIKQDRKVHEASGDS